MVEGWKKPAVGLAVVALAALTLAVEPPVSPEAALRAGRGALGVLAWAVAATGLGGAVLKESEAAEAFAVGAGLLGLAIGILGFFGLISTPMLVGLAVAAAACWILRPAVALPTLPSAWAAPALALGLLEALAPPMETDEVYQHMALAKAMLQTGELLGGLLHPDGSRPLPMQCLYAAAMAFGGEAGPKLLHLLFGAALLSRVQRAAASAGEGAAPIATVLLIGSYTFARELGLAHNDLPAALLCMVALERRGGSSALAAGLALALKYTAAPALLGAWLWQLKESGDLKTQLRLGGLALLAVAPWWLRNLLDGLHPLFPYAGWPGDVAMEFAFAERYGMGREPLDFLMLPWNAVVHGDPTSYTFLGRLSPAFLAAVPALALARPRWGLPAAVALVGWAIGPQWLRYLLPALPIVAVALADASRDLPRFGQVALTAAALAGLPANWGPWLEGLVPAIPVALGEGDREALLRERVPGYSSARYASENLPADARVALLMAWPTYYVDRPWVLGSVEDHVPVRHLLLTQGEQALPMLQGLGVTHVISGRINFLKRVYPFLTEEEFQAQFEAPEALLQRQLLARGELLFEEGRYGVWRLLPPEPAE